MSRLLKVSNEKILRGLILEICEQSGATGASIELIQVALKYHIQSITKEEVLNTCKYLEGKNLITMNHTENERLKISRDIVYLSSKGQDLLDGTITVDGIQLVGD